MNQVKHILVLGGSGFIGRHVLNALSHHVPHIRVTTLLRHPVDVPQGIQVQIGDLQSFEWSALDAHPPDHIIHLARINSSRFGSIGRRLAASSGNKANNRLLRYIKKKNWNSKITYVSGSLMYGNQSGFADEASPLNPVSFAKEYIAAERPFLDYPFAQIVRLPWVFGNGSWFKSFYLQPIRNGNAIPVYGDGQNRMSFIHVKDAGKMIAEIALNEDFGTFNLTMENPLSQAEFCALLEEISGKKVEIIPNLSLRKKFEKAIYEAFTTSIPLKSQYQKRFNEHAEFTSAEDMLRKELPILLK